MRKMVTFADVRTAREDCAPNLYEIVAWLASPEKEPITDKKEETLTRIRGEILESSALLKGTSHRPALGRLESDRNRLPDRLALGGFILDLWRDGGAYAREQLIAIARSTPLTWGAWQGLKAVFKQAEHERDLELFGVLAARFDAERASRRRVGEVSMGTLTYLVRRAWRELRRTAMSLSASYPDAAVEILRFYPADCRIDRAFLAQKIFDRDSRRKISSASSVGAPQFHNPPFADLWRISPRPLLTLLERAESETVRSAASRFLMRDFRGSLSDLHPIHISRLIETGSPTAHRFCVWLLQGRLFEHSAFREIGLHDAVLGLVDSLDPEARRFAAEYLRTYARDAHIETVVKTAACDDLELVDAAADILEERGGEEVSNETWARLASKEATFELAAAALKSAFKRDKFDETVVEELLVSDDERSALLGKSLLDTVDPKSVDASFLTRTAQNSAVDPRVRADCLTRLAIAKNGALSGKDRIDIIEELPAQFEAQLIAVIAEHTDLSSFARDDTPAWVRSEGGVEKLWSNGLGKGRRAGINRKILASKLAPNAKNSRLSQEERNAARGVLFFERVFAGCEHQNPAVRRFSLRLLPFCLETRWDVDIAIALAESDNPDVVYFAHKTIEARENTFEYSQRDRLVRTLGLSHSHAARAVGIALASRKEWFLSSATLMALMRGADNAVRRLAVEKAWRQTGTDGAPEAEVFFSLLREGFKQVQNDIEDGCRYLKGQRAVTTLLDTIAQLGIQNAVPTTVALTFLKTKRQPATRAEALAHMAAIRRLENAAHIGENKS